MPIINSSYKAPRTFRNPHVNTIYASQFRRVTGVIHERERLWLDDGDFLDVDWSFAHGEKKSDKVAVIFHGLEGNSKRPYVLGMAKILNQNGFDNVSVNLRGCSGEENLSYKTYHSGATDDVEAIVNHVLQKDKYRTIDLVGFSLGGNLILKYLGEDRKLPATINKGVAISTPVDLKESLDCLNQNINLLYRFNFLLTMRSKFKNKLAKFETDLDPKQIKKIKTFEAFDNLYTAPAHGFKDAMDYYAKSSSAQFLQNIQQPTLLINAKDDTFMSGNCYPHKQAEANSNLFLELPETGGHVGFVKRTPFYYNEERALEFLR